ncbi:MAG: DUF1573 domain-containing protein [Sphingobacteriales bacterium]|jgi:hypothetical protein|nr:DUF1573 domain-containing protein [Sphingobacteriales bacterium]
MKKLLFSIAALTLTTGLFAQKKADEIAKFKSETIEMGKIKQDIPATAIFEVTNIGSEPLIIDEANPTCGCTIGDYTKEPIAPGKTGFIKATYNAKNLNAFEKHLTVKFAGVTDVKSITIKGEVLNAEDYAKIAPAAETKDDKIITSDNKVKAAPSSTPAKKTTTTKTTTTVKKPA